MASFQQSASSDIAKNPGSAVKVKKEEATEIAASNRSRISLTLTNDSEEAIIYVFKGEKAKVKEGMRLNAKGGATIIDDYTGVVTAASAVAEGLLGVVEV